NVPGWETDNARPSARKLRSIRTHSQQALSVARFVAKNDRFPAASSHSKRERRLGIWLRNQRQAAKGKGTICWTAVKQNRMDRMIPGWENARPPIPVASSPLR